MQNDQIMVSICCLAYNHEKYIRKCLNGFLMQKTDFNYEVLIHDDASTDQTTNIIREYEILYPDVIKPIYQKENQYSKGVRIDKQYQYPRAKGKYIALCEGDDYWTDELKLQKQVDYLENHPEYTMCVHQALVYNHKTNRISFVTKQESDRDYTVEETILGGGELFATNTIVANKSVFTTMPECFSAKGFGDYQLFIYGAISGVGLHYIKENMSVYNACTEGSWTQRIQLNKEELLKHKKEKQRMLHAVDVYYEGKYHNTIQYECMKTEYEILKIQGRIIGIHRKQYSQFYKNEKQIGGSPNKECLAYAFPWLVKIKNIFKKKY